MGASSSVKTEKTEPIKEEDPKIITRRNHQNIAMIERFVSTVYTNCPSIESMWLILSNKLGQKAFQSFVKAENCEEYFATFLATSEVLAKQDPSVEFWISHFETIKGLVLDAEGELVGIISPFLRNELSFGPQNEHGIVELAHIKSLLERTQTELVQLMAKDLFNRFVSSKYYKNWRACEASHASATTFEDASLSATEYSSSLQSSTKSRTGANGQVSDALLSVCAVWLCCVWVGERCAGNGARSCAYAVWD